MVLLSFPTIRSGDLGRWCGDLTRIHSIEVPAASGVDQLRNVRTALDQLGNEMGIFTRIYDEVGIGHITGFSVLNRFF